MMKRFCVVASIGALGSFGSIAAATWPSDPTVNLPVAVKPGDQAVQKIATMPDGTTWLGWFDNSAGSYQVFVQRLDPAGNASFAPGGLLVSANPQSTSLVDWDLTVDGGGNCFLAFTDTRDGGDLDVFAYLISPAGAFLWGANGVQVSSTNSDFEADPRVLVSSNGEYLVVWPRSTTVGLYLQRISAAGSIELPVGGVKIAGDGPEGPAFAELVGTPDGGFIALWQRDTRTFASPRHLRAMKFNSSGAAQWGSAVEVSNGNVVPIASRQKLIADGNGGAAMGWHDGRTGSSRAYVQRVDSAGAILFAAGGSQCSNTSVMDFDPAIAFVPGTDDLMAFFDQRDGGQNQRGLLVQKFNASGSRQFGTSGLVLEPVDSVIEGFQRAVPATGGATVLFMQSHSVAAGNELRAIRVDADGDPVWAGSPIAVSIPATTKFRLNITADAGGQVRACWQDGRNDQSDIYAQNINPDSSLGVAPVSCPGDANGDLVINAADLSVLLSNFGQPAAGPGFGDFNGDGVCNGADLSVLLGTFGSSC